ncbi:MAG TPA: hypothetical protein VGB50_11090 [Flavobacterium sp.]|jgi:hypothetical protein
MEKPEDGKFLRDKQRNLYLGLLFDGIGMLSFTIPFIGEFSDVVWAPVSGIILSKMYKGATGITGGILSFIEEAIPFTDVIPTFTLTWIYNYYLRKK